MLLAMVLTATLAGVAAPESSPSAALPSNAFAAPLASAIAHYQTVDTYRVTIHSFHADGEEHILYYFKRPGYVRMEFIRPHTGALLIYSPKTERVRLWPFGYGHFPELNLSPGNPLIKSSPGQRVDHSDVGALFENMRILQEHGGTELLGKEMTDGRTVLHLNTTGSGQFAVDGVHRMEWWLDAESLFPIKIISWNAHGAMLETVNMDALEINLALPDTMFNP